MAQATGRRLHKQDKALQTGKSKLKPKKEALLSEQKEPPQQPPAKSATAAWLRTKVWRDIPQRNLGVSYVQYRTVFTAIFDFIEEVLAEEERKKKEERLSAKTFHAHRANTNLPRRRK